jgi:gamma-glutamylputrescine oxidase
LLNEVFWVRGREIRRRPKLTGSRTAKAVIIGGGITGLTVADELLRRGVEGVVLLEGRYCGSGASGRSSGFITPASELELRELRRRFGDDEARVLWDGAQAGCDAIRETIERYRIACDVLPADSLIVASDECAFDVVQQEHEARRALGYESRLYDRAALRQVVGSDTFGGAVRFGGTFSINSFDYVRALSERLAGSDVEIFEDSAATSVSGREVRTREATLRADTVFFCLDHAASRLGTARREAYHAQTFLMVSDPLDENLARSLFPSGPLLVWDTDLVYQYFRLTADRRLLLGGGLLSRMYAGERPNDAAAREHLLAYARARFPQLEHLRFEAMWPGLIGVTKDFLPLAGKIRGGDPHFVALCSAGLPWSVLAAKAAVQGALEGATDLDRFFRPHRSFTEVDLIQPLVSKPVAFALSHAYAKTLLRGDERQVSRRKRVIKKTVLGAAAAALLAIASKRLRRR